MAVWSWGDECDGVGGWLCARAMTSVMGWGVAVCSCGVECDGVGVEAC